MKFIYNGSDISEPIPIHIKMGQKILLERVLRDKDYVLFNTLLNNGCGIYDIVDSKDMVGYFRGIEDLKRLRSTELTAKKYISRIYPNGMGLKAFQVDLLASKLKGTPMEFGVSLVEGVDIESAYEAEYGGHSCMTGYNKSENIQLYAKNPGKVFLAKIAPPMEARALIWACDDGRWFIDRVFARDSAHIPNGYLVIEAEMKALGFKNIVKYSDNGTKKLKATVNIASVAIPPYLDSFHYPVNLKRNGDLTLSTYVNSSITGSCSAWLDQHATAFIFTCAGCGRGGFHISQSLSYIQKLAKIAEVSSKFFDHGNGITNLYCSEACLMMKMRNSTFTNAIAAEGKNEIY